MSPERGKAKIALPTFLKWVGGKRKVLSQLDKYVPREIDRYFEPFLGGGSVFFYIVQKYKPRYCMISDINKDLIRTYIDVRDSPSSLLKRFRFFSENNSKNFYYITRQQFNQAEITGVARSAAFIYLNKTCFNGIYRVNAEGKFNVPFSGRKIPYLQDEDIINASNLLRGVRIKCQDYEKIKYDVLEDDFIYLDPCYDPLTKNSFVNYTPDKFKVEDRIRLAKFVNCLRSKGARVMLSNNDIRQVRELYDPRSFKIRNILSPRCISSKASSRGQIKELVITC